MNNSSKNNHVAQTDKDKTSQRITGVIDHIVYTNEETGYTVAKLKQANGRMITIIGILAGLHAQESLNAEGIWKTDAKYGDQFQIESYTKILPTTATAIQGYLASGVIRGVGQEYARRIVERFGTDVFDIIENAPQRLREVEGIGNKRYKDILSSWEEHKVLRDIVIFLQQHEISITLAPKVYREYGNGAIEQMKKNPYRLAMDIRGIAYKKADSIAKKLNIPHDSIERVKAGVFFFLSENTLSGGHTFANADDFIERAAMDIDVPQELVVQGINALNSDGIVILDAEHHAIYLKEWYQHEVSVAANIVKIARTQKRIPTINGDEACHQFEESEGTGFVLDAKQREAIKTALRGGVLIITGGPGTGKTTIIRSIIHAFKAHGISFKLAAPTGRAAKRMQETSHEFAMTIHRMLNYRPDMGGWQMNAAHPIKTDVVLVDESSMIDISLADALLKAIRPQSSIIFVGDSDQLPSVGPGSFLKDIINCGMFPVVKLETIHRQAQHSLIISNAHTINKGEFPILPGNEVDGNGNFLFVHAATPEEAAAKVRKLVAQDLPQRFSYDSMKDIQVLSPMHKIRCVGCADLNSELQKALNPRGVSVQRGMAFFRVKDKIMQTENDYDKEVFNGDIGTITSIEPVEQQLTASFDGRPVTYDFKELDEIEPAYAITVHKSQGSEYKCVVLVLMASHFVMLQRNLLYTAVTRGRKHVIVVGQRKAIAMALANTGDKRLSALDNRIRKRMS
ncbi:ATP-dependent RecD-like DNA helicase [Candidatus Sumerlaeota bacterium]|nr:ATP-dependent RecD-like DNA helicase [Candidatus Sumerlaeota bacterium]